MKSKNNSVIKKLQLDTVIANLYHIGRIIETTNSSFNPNSILPGTWNKLPENTFTATAGITTVGNYGGNNDAIVVSHNHTENNSSHTHTTNNAKGTTSGWFNIRDVEGSPKMIQGADNSMFTYTDPQSGGDCQVDWNSGGWYQLVKLNITNHQHDISSSGEHSHTINSAGSSGTNKNMPKYLAVIKWIRVA